MIHSGDILDTLAYQDKEIRIIDCAECGFIHADPYPTQAELEGFYNSIYFAKLKPDLLASEQNPLLEADILDEIETRTVGRLLDVGCGAGFFMQAAAARGWQVEGIEPSDQCYDYCVKQGLKIHKKYLTDKPFPELGLFDAIHAREIINHSPNPLAFLDACWYMLYPDGLICGSVPNDYSDLQIYAHSKQGGRKWWLSYPSHLNYFDLASLDRILYRAGFQLVGVQGTYPMELFLVAGKNYVDHPLIGKACHRERLKIDNALEEIGIRRQLYRQNAHLGVGREIIFVARKVEK